MPKRRGRQKERIIAGTSGVLYEPKKSFGATLKKFIYNKETKEILGRTCRGWIQIICYSIMYLIFLSTFTLICLYCALIIIRENPGSNAVDKILLMTYADDGIGISAIPTLQERTLILYQKGNAKQYQPYVDFLDRYFDSNKYRNKREACVSELGPCGCPPYGYGEAPCIFVRINKQIGWSANPLAPNTAAANNAPPEVQKWLKTDNKLWIYCCGENSYDKEHLGDIKYYPNPPGLDPNLFPQNMSSRSPLVAVQFTKFTLGIMLNIKCKLYYDLGTSSISLLLHVAHENTHKSSGVL